MNYHSLLDEMVNTRRHFLILGRSGSGKSHLIRSFLDFYPGRVLVTAPTSCATQEVPGSVTNHSAFGLIPSVAFKWESARLTRGQIEAIACCDTWILDEASMVRKDIFEKINQIFQEVRGNCLPFGGTRLVAVGDFWQLPPVTTSFEEEYVMAATDGVKHSEYFLLTSRALANRDVCANLRMVELGGSFRQNDEEIEFLKLLDRVRMGILTDTDLWQLNSRFRWDNPNQIPILTSTRRARDLYNTLYLSNLDGKRYSSDPIVTWAEGEIPIPSILDDHPGTKRLDLVVGMRVVFNKNDSAGKQWVNGSCGTIREIRRSDHRTVAGLVVQIDGKVSPVLVARQDFEIYMPGMNKFNTRACTKRVVTVNQFPVEPGYAMTIHKSQGKTMDSAIIDLGRGAFAPGQLYVALSRLRSFSGLHLATMIKAEDALASRFVKTFYGITRFAKEHVLPT